MELSESLSIFAQNPETNSQYNDEGEAGECNIYPLSKNCVSKSFENGNASNGAEHKSNNCSKIIHIIPPMEFLSPKSFWKLG
ncbi:MAG: hypothetical protein WC449_01420 [Candidatus Paceibacterota bacterium]